MNLLNHTMFSVALSLIFIQPVPLNLIYVIIFSLIFGDFIDLDHKLKPNVPWYRKRTWLQEPFGFIILGLPTALLLSFVNKTFFILVLIPYISHITLDYLCVFEAHPLAPFSKIKKKEGLGIFVPDDPLKKSKNSKRWSRRVKTKGLSRISENYFSVLNLIFFLFVLLLKFGQAGI